MVISGLIHDSLSTFQNAILSATPYLISCILSYPASLIADWLLFNNHLSVTRTRKLFATLTLLLPAMAFTCLAFAGCDSVLVMACLCVATGATACQGASLSINQIDLAPNFAGTLMGITNSASNLMGFVAPMIVGWIVDKGVSRLN